MDADIDNDGTLYDDLPHEDIPQDDDTTISPFEDDRRRRLGAVGAVVATAAIWYNHRTCHELYYGRRLVDDYITKVVPRLFEQPYYTCPFKGIDWLNDLLDPDSHPERIRACLGVRSHVFYALVEVLRQLGYSNSREVQLEEQLAIFLHCCVKGLPVIDLGERFQRSNDTITK